MVQSQPRVLICAEDPAHERVLQNLRLSSQDGGSIQSIVLPGIPQRTENGQVAVGATISGSSCVPESSSHHSLTETQEALEQQSASDFPEAVVSVSEQALLQLTHPRSSWLRSALADPVEDFKAIAKVLLVTCLRFPGCSGSCPGIDSNIHSYRWTE